jgi:PPOX class probable F420-dependent enzyme
MSTLATPQVEEFLTAQRNAIVATLKRDGMPQLSPVWYLYDQGTLYVSIRTETAKYHNLKRDPRLSICIDGGPGDFRSVTAYGTADLIEPGEARQAELRRWVIGRYHADEAGAQRYYDSVKAAPAAIIVLKPESVILQGFN